MDCASGMTEEISEPLLIKWIFTDENGNNPSVSTEYSSNAKDKVTSYTIEKFSLVAGLTYYIKIRS